MGPRSSTESYPAFARIGLRQSSGVTIASRLKIHDLECRRKEKEETLLVTSLTRSLRQLASLDLKYPFLADPGTRGDEGHDIHPFYGPISGKIGRLLRKHGIKTIHKPPTKIQNLLRPVKDDLGLRTPGVYRKPLAQHSLETGHKIDFGATTILDKTSSYRDLVIKEAIEIQLDGNNFNRDGGLQLSTAWKPAINMLRPPAHSRQSGPASSS
ncbi:hypothetical protein ANN_19954 [Periplaneta americana]|uniref:Uncharacterized protein n=1 Tax=Periplaneta americana TaxID=6978 RepID=A0ABQ8SBN4_PERAM|nr:hypothetical protein ANN_19954 [Periplaneta americana]